MESSRIFVRSLPPKFTEDDVRKHFSKFPVTDVKYFPARRIGYIGYKTPQDASKAIKYFNKSFIRMTKIHVETARPIIDKELPKSRRQQREERNELQNVGYIPPPRDNNLNLKRKRVEPEVDLKLKEYLDVMQPPSTTKTWANEEAQLETTAALEAPTSDDVGLLEGESDNEYQVIAKQPKVSHPKSPTVAETAPEMTSETTSETTTKAWKHQEKHNTRTNMLRELPDAPSDGQGVVSDADWLRSRTNRVLDLVQGDKHDPPGVVQPEETEEVEEALEGEEEQHVDPRTGEDTAHAAATEEDKVRETGRLFLRNLHYDVTVSDLRDHFEKYGTIEEVHVPAKKIDGKGKGFAFVQFEEPEPAVQAYLNNDGIIFQGRILHIISGKMRKDGALDDFAISKLPLKKQKEIMRKKSAGTNAFNWNSLYLNSDAVLSSVAERLNINKAELLDHTSSDAAVKQAQAETHVIQETKNYFAQQGVDLEAFKKSSKGDVAILVKNIPYSVKADEMRKLFEEQGTLRRFLFPPMGMTAIAEFVSAAQAKSAFMALSYRKIKDSILYLEKAPKDLFKEGIVIPSAPTTITNTPSAKLSAKDLLEDAPKPDSTNIGTLHVKNLNFSTTTQKLSETFAPLAGFRSAIVRTKIDPKRGVLSLGYGFVEFISPDAAAAALRAMDSYSLEGHSLKIQASHRGADAAEERRKEVASKKADSTKILIKNLPFEATKKDVRALFAPYGALRSVRVPKKFDSSSRGFGFAEFSTQRDATNAVNALKNTHLLGRRLVLAFAETESDDAEQELEKMQQKIGLQANKVALQRLTSGGRKKFNVAGTDDLDEA